MSAHRLALGCLLWLGACDDAPSDVATPTGCQESATCPVGDTCVAGVCVGTTFPSFPVKLRLIPPSDSGLAPSELVGELRFEASTLRLSPITLSPRVDRLGKVVTADGHAVTAQVLVRTLSGLEGAPLSFTSESLNRDGQPGFVLTVPRWWPKVDGGRLAVAAQARLQPEPSALPPWDVPSWPVPDSGLTQFLFTLPETGALPEAAALTPLDGEVLVSLDNPTPLRGLAVQAQNQDGHPVSTTATTDENGLFRLRFWPEHRSQAVRLKVSSPAGTQRPLPVITPTLADDATFTRIYMGETGESFEVSGQLGQTDAPVALAWVRFRAEVGNGRLDVRTRADDQGRFTVSLFAGTYLVDVEPPMERRVSARLTRRELTVAPGETLKLLPQARTQAFGRVVDWTGAPVARARVVAELLEATYSDPRLARPGEAPPTRRVEAQADADGAFVMPLDPGRHRLILTPEPQSGLPSAQVTVEVPDLPVLSWSDPLVIPSAAALLLTVVDEDGEGVAGVTVEAWREDGDNPVRLAAGTTDDSGALSLGIAVTP